MKHTICNMNFIKFAIENPAPEYSKILGNKDARRDISCYLVALNIIFIGIKNILPKQLMGFSPDACGTFWYR